MLLFKLSLCKNVTNNKAISILKGKNALVSYSSGSTTRSFTTKKQNGPKIKDQGLKTASSRSASSGTSSGAKAANPSTTSASPASSGSSLAYKSLTIGVPKEVWPAERRVSLVPAAVSVLIKKGVSVHVEDNAGLEAKFMNADYEAAGAKIVDKKKVFDTDVILKVRQPIESELNQFRNGGNLISFIFPGQNAPLVDQLSKKKMNVFAMDW